MTTQPKRMYPADIAIELGQEWEALDDVLMELRTDLPIWEKGGGDDDYERIVAFREMTENLAADPPDPTNTWAQEFLLTQTLNVLYTLTNGSTLEYMIGALNPVMDPQVRQHYVNFLGLLYGLCQSQKAQLPEYADTCREIRDLIDSGCGSLLPLVKA